MNIDISYYYEIIKLLLLLGENKAKVGQNIPPFVGDVVQMLLYSQAHESIIEQIYADEYPSN